MFIRVVAEDDKNRTDDRDKDDDAKDAQHKKTQTPPKLVLKFECKNCGHMSDGDDVCIMKSSYDDDRTVYKKFMSKYIAHDVTLPRVNNIRCPTCSTGEEGKTGLHTDVIYVKYDENLKFLYSCETCGTFWKSG